jgi:hypothetical protein
MSPRIVQNVAKPLVVAGAIWGTMAIGDVLATPGQTPPPCSPDGHCVPRPETFGWYQTRWRRFPGDPYGVAPTPAEAGADVEQEREERTLGGPQLPKAAEEAQVGPPRPARSNDQRDVPAATPPAEAPPGGAPPAAPAEGPGPAAPPAAAPRNDAAPGTQPLPDLGAPPPLGEPSADDVTDPFSAAPRRPINSNPEGFGDAQPPTSEIAEQSSPAFSAPIRHREDAPPPLPASLQRVSQTMPTPATQSAVLSSLPPLQQPSSIAARQAGPSPIARVNYQTSTSPRVEQAAGTSEPHGNSQLEQALYYEASDQDEEILRY